MNILLLDIGNTSIGMAISIKGKIVVYDSLSFIAFKQQVENWIKKYNLTLVLVCSVVPDITKKLKVLFKKYKLQFLECGVDVKIPVKNLYDNPQEVGCDRLISVYSASSIYKNKNVRLIIDVGTALTFDFISSSGAYTGGLIFPGMEISLSGLLSKCALLPKKMQLYSVTKIQAKTTKDGINNGIIFGYSFLVKGLISHIKQKKKNFNVLVTGGSSDLLIKKIAGFNYQDKYLVLKGLNVLATNL